MNNFKITPELNIFQFMYNNNTESFQKSKKIYKIKRYIILLLSK